MSRRGHYKWLIALPPLLMAACGTAQATDPPGATTHQPAATSSAMPGMDVHGDMPGRNMPGRSSPSQAGQGTPSATSQMVCSTEIRQDVATLLALPALPHVASSWTNHRYTCTYHLPTGALSISVQESANRDSALAYFTGVRARSAGAETLTGVASFGLPAFQAADGTAGFVKDNMTLLVDPSALPSTVGRSSRTEFAYTVASDILGCWNGD
jgi:hypothetical protein